MKNGHIKAEAVAVGTLLLLWGAEALAQNGAPPSDADGCAACAGCGGVFVLVPIVFFVVIIALLVWVARDAKSRGMDSSILWMLLVMFTNVIGLVIYIFSRPQGELTVCQHCKGNHLQTSARCPHCGNSTGPSGGASGGYWPQNGGPGGGGGWQPPSGGGYGAPPGGGGQPPGGYGAPSGGGGYGQPPGGGGYGGPPAS